MNRPEIPDSSEGEDKQMITAGPWEWVWNGTRGQWQLVNAQGVPVNLGGPPDVPLSDDQRAIAEVPKLIAACCAALEALNGDQEPEELAEANRTLHAALVPVLGHLPAC